MKNVIDINQFRPQRGPEMDPGQLANILEKALGCLEPGYELAVLAAVLKKCTRAFSANGSEVDKAAVLEEGRYSLYRFSLKNNVLIIRFERGPIFLLKSAYFLDPQLSKEITIALELEVELNAGKRRIAALALQDASCIE